MNRQQDVYLVQCDASGKWQSAVVCGEGAVVSKLLTYAGIFFIRECCVFCNGKNVELGSCATTGRVSTRRRQCMYLMFYVPRLQHGTIAPLFFHHFFTWRTANTWIEKQKNDDCLHDSLFHIQGNHDSHWLCIPRDFGTATALHLCVAMRNHGIKPDFLNVVVIQAP